MLYPQVPSKKWADQYQIKTTGVFCPECRSALDLNKAVALKGYRGLEAQACPSCKAESGIVRFVPVDQEKIELWQSLRPAQMAPGF